MLIPTPWCFLYKHIYRYEVLVCVCQEDMINNVAKRLNYKEQNIPLTISPPQSHTEHFLFKLIFFKIVVQFLMLSKQFVGRIPLRVQALRWSQYCSVSCNTKCVQVISVGVKWTLRTIWYFFLFHFPKKAGHFLVLIQHNEEQKIRMRCVIDAMDRRTDGQIDRFNINKSICLRYDCVSFILYNKTWKSPQVMLTIYWNIENCYSNTQSKFQRELKAHNLNSSIEDKQSLGNLSFNSLWCH